MDADRLFAALADPTRRRILFEVSQGRSVTEVATRLPVSQPAVSQHLRVLLEAGLVSVEPEGRRRIYRLRPEGLEALRSWADRLWTEALDAFAASFDEEALKRTREARDGHATREESDDTRTGAPHPRNGGDR